MTAARITQTLGLIAAVIFGLVILAIALGVVNEVVGAVIHSVRG